MKRLLLGLTLAPAICLAQWSDLNSGTVNFLQYLSSPNAMTVYSAADNGILHGSTDGGMNWANITSLNTVYPIWFTDAQTGHGGSAANEILRTIDGGQNWTIQTTLPGSMILGSLYFLDANTGFAAATDLSTGNIYSTIDAGANWNMVGSFSSPDIPVIAFTDANAGYTLGNLDQIFKTIDGGATWNLTYDGGFINILYGLHFIDANNGFACGTDGARIIHTSDAGASWDTLLTGNGLPLYDIHFVSIDTGFAVGGDGITTGMILGTTDGGASWTVAHTNTKTYNAIDCPTPNLCYASGTGGLMSKMVKPVGLNEFVVEDRVDVWPNPSAGLINISTTQPATLLDVGGRFIKRFAPDNQFDLSSYPDGLYLIRLGEEVKKVVLQR